MRARADDLDAVRGIMLGVVIGAVFWSILLFLAFG
jgi:hypothetical protein